MPSFTYEALDGGGAVRRGQRSAVDHATLMRDLRADGLFLTLVQHHAGSHDRQPIRWSPWGWWAAMRPLRQSDIAFFFRQFALMLRAGLSVIDGLKTIERLTPNRHLAVICADLVTQIEAGQTVAQSLARHPTHFDSLIQALVATGEATGELDALAERIVELIQRRGELRNQIITSLIYPAVVLLMGCGVAAFLVIKVIPQFAKFFANRSKQLPASTQALMDVSAFLTTTGPYLFALLLLLVGGVLLLRWWQRTRYSVDRLVLLTPVLGAVFSSGAMALLGSNLALLLKSGVGLVEALRILKTCMSNECYRRRIENARQSVIRGDTIAGGIAGAGIPDLVPQLIAVGERAGAVDRICHEIGHYYDGDLRLRIRQLTALFEPTVIVVIGGMVGFVYFAFFQAIFAIAQ